MSSKPTRPRGRLINVVACIIIVYMVVLFFGQQMEILSMGRQQQVLLEKLSRLESRRADLFQERELLNTSGYVEAVAREQLGLVKEGEILYTIVGQDDS